MYTASSDYLEKYSLTLWASAASFTEDNNSGRASSIFFCSAQQNENMKKWEYIVWTHVTLLDLLHVKCYTNFLFSLYKRYRSVAGPDGFVSFDNVKNCIWQNIIIYREYQWNIVISKNLPRFIYMLETDSAVLFSAGSDETSPRRPEKPARTTSGGATFPRPAAPKSTAGFSSMEHLTWRTVTCRDIDRCFLK